MSAGGRLLFCSYGTGNPDLLTLRTTRALSDASLILAPRALPDVIRSLASPAADWALLDDQASPEEAEPIWTALSPRLAAGQTIVRLCPDDPMLSQTAVAEMRWLVRRGIACEIVPGPARVLVAAAYAGIPLAALGPWQLGGLRVRNLSDAADFAFASGDESGFLVRDAALASQSVEPISREQAVATERFDGVAFLGLDCRDPELAWFERLPLFGRRVLVTRGREQAAVLSQRLRALGAEPIELPTIEIRPPDDLDALDRAVRGLTSYDWVIFTSANGVDALFARLDALGLDARSFGRSHVAAIGEATAARLRAHGLRADFVPPRFVAESVLAGLLERGVAGQRALLARAAEARGLLPEGLRAAGALVDVVAAYRTVPANPDPATLRRLSDGEVDVITLTSSSTARNLLALVGGRLELLNRAAIACIGPITAATAHELGLRVDLVADEFSITGLVDALAQAGAALQRSSA